MADLTLNDNLYLAPSSAGAYYAAADPSMEPARRLLFKLMRDASTPFLNESNLQSWTGADIDESLNLLLRLQSLGWAVGLVEQETAPTQPLEQLVQFFTGFNNLAGFPGMSTPFGAVTMDDGTTLRAEVHITAGPHEEAKIFAVGAFLAEQPQGGFSPPPANHYGPYAAEFAREVAAFEQLRGLSIAQTSRSAE